VFCIRGSASRRSLPTAKRIDTFVKKPDVARRAIDRPPAATRDFVYKIGFPLDRLVPPAVILAGEVNPSNLGEPSSVNAPAGPAEAAVAGQQRGVFPTLTLSIQRFLIES
jgi:hypothetical protein